MKETIDYLRQTDFPAIKRSELTTLQVNLGYLCNQQCLHCHVDASPRRSEIMRRETIDAVLNFIRKKEIKTLDLTGGAPEMNPDFSYLVSQAKALGVHVIDRCNLTILTEEGYSKTAEFLALNEVEVIASLPCYLQENVDAQRGQGVFDKSIEGLLLLNKVGYGVKESLPLNLVFNPQGTNLPPEQSALEKSYKQMLLGKFGITFNHLYTIANMPIKRFGSTLLSKGLFTDYMETLRRSHQTQNLGAVMCRSTLSVDWQGYVYDCDFNQMLQLPAGLTKTKNVPAKITLHDCLEMDFSGKDIAIMDHCYGCTAGQGSSCGGALL